MTPSRRILLATGNPGKLREIQAVLGSSLSVAPLRVSWVSLSDLPHVPPEPVETQPDFAGNARLKAVHYSMRTRLWTMADDSGLEVDALSGEPGVLSARYARISGDDRAAIDLANNRKLIARLRGVPREARTARFRCVLVLADGERILAETQGMIEGRIIDEPRGAAGFGYDPHFFVDALGCTTAQLDAEQKNRVSHRGQALRRLAEILPGLLTAGDA